MSVIFDMADSGFRCEGMFYPHDGKITMVLYGTMGGFDQTAALRDKLFTKGVGFGGS